MDKINAVALDWLKDSRAVFSGGNQINAPLISGAYNSGSEFDTNGADTNSTSFAKIAESPEFEFRFNAIKILFDPVVPPRETFFFFGKDGLEKFQDGKREIISRLVYGFPGGPVAPEPVAIPVAPLKTKRPQIKP